jgi:two-component system, LytTR family, sensor kinase
LFSNSIVFNWVEERYVHWILQPLRSIMIAIFVHVSYSTFVIFVINWFWHSVFMHRSFHEFIVTTKGVMVIEFIILIAITLVFYVKSFFIAWRDSAIEGEKLKSDAIQLQYQILQNQINPHFLFNSLNVLGSLIDLDTNKAKTFVAHLAQFYRELLQFKDIELVTVLEEIRFVEKYIYLQKIRFGEMLRFDVDIPQNLTGQVIPMSVQMLVENAIKHNIISSEKPLQIRIGVSSNDRLFVENNLQPKEFNEGSNRIGLNNLKSRYEFLTDKEVKIEKTDAKYSVTLPLISLEE